MSLTIKHLNADCTFILDFAPAFATTPNINRVHGAFTILIDPWLAGHSSVFHPSFQYTKHVDTPHIASLADLDQAIDLIIISQDKPDHCHRETLCSLPKDKHVNILATSAAAKKIKSWNFFAETQIHILPAYKPERQDSLVRIPLPAYTSTSQPGEITIAHLPTKRDLTRVHNAIAITYRPPSTIFTTRSLTNNKDDEKQSQPQTLSLLYTPHGISPSTFEPYLTHHLKPTAGLSLTALLHAFNHERNPSCLGGEVMRGAPGGISLLDALSGKVDCWVGAHDARVEAGGWSTWWLRSRRYSAREVELWVRDEGWASQVVDLGVGQSLRLGS